MKPLKLWTICLLLPFAAMMAQDFDTPLINPFNLTTEGARSSPYLVDIDNDDDLDVFTGYVGGQFGFYENTGTSSAPDFDNVVFGPFGLTDLSGDCAPMLADLDDDGDLDMMAGSDSGLIFFENLGNAASPTFGPAVMNPFGLIGPTGNNKPDMADLDADGDLDLIVGSSDGNLYYYMNTGTAANPAFAASQSNPFGLSNAGSRSAPDLVDLDSDGDFDLMIGNQSGQFIYYENTGSANAPAFSLISENPFNLSNVGQTAKPNFTDLDDDGDSDLLAGNAVGEYYYFENIAPLGIGDQQNIQALIYPNPFHLYTHIDLNDVRIGKAQLFVTDCQGRIVFRTSEITPDGSIIVHRNGMRSGIYFVYLQHSNSRTFLGRLIAN